MTTTGTRAEDHIWCWRCGRAAAKSDRYLHRADNPVLAHYRCPVCNDVLMLRPQPSMPEKLDQLATHLEQAYQWARTRTTENPSDPEQAALNEITVHLTKARRVYFQQLDPRITGNHTYDTTDGTGPAATLEPMRALTGGDA